MAEQPVVGSYPGALKLSISFMNVVTFVRAELLFPKFGRFGGSNPGFFATTAGFRIKFEAGFGPGRFPGTRIRSSGRLFGRNTSKAAETVAAAKIIVTKIFSNI